MPKKIIESLEVLKVLDPIEEAVEEDEIEVKPTPSVKVKPVKEDKRKTTPRTDKQMEAFAKVQEIRQVNRDGRAKEREIQEEEFKKDNEAKIIKKAISIKKKQIKKQIILDEISDDDEPIEMIKEKILKSSMKAKKPILIPEEPKDTYTVRFI